MLTIEDVTRKINKLLLLSNSANEAEANAAMAKAMAICAENNLELETVAILGGEQRKHEEVTQEEFSKDNGKLLVTDHFVHPLLVKHFGIRIIYNSYQRQTKVTLIGTPTDIKTANEIYFRLTDIFNHLWVSYKARTNAPTTHKKSYFSGVYLGISSTLEAEKQSIIQSKIDLLPEAIDKDKARERYSLVLSESTARNEKYIRAKYAKLGTKAYNSGAYVGDARADGYKDGRGVDVSGKRKALM